MATNKPRTKRKNSKVIDMTGGVPAPVRKLIDRLTTEVKRTLIATNIPVFKTIAQDKEVVSHFFLNRAMYFELLGSNMALFDRVVRTAFSTVLTKDIMSSMFERDNTTYPGLWDSFHIQGVVISMINMATIADDPSAGWYLSAHNHRNGMPTKAQAEEYKPNGWMPFNEYSPVRLQNFLAVVQLSVINAIVTEIENNVPAATFAVTGEPVTVRYGREFGMIMAEPLREKMEEGASIDEEAENFIHKFERPLMTFMIAMLGESGFDVDIIGKILGQSKAIATYNVEAKNGKKATYFFHPWTKLVYTLVDSAGTGLRTAPVEFNPADIRTAAEVWEKNKNLVDDDGKPVAPVLSTDERNACNRLGKSIMAYLDAMSTYVINMTINSNNLNVATTVKDMQTTTEEPAADEANDNATSEI